MAAYTYALRPWRAPYETFLVDTRYPPGDARRTTDITVTCYGGWVWDTVDGHTYRTSGEGDGLWQYDPRSGDWHQIAGMCQFSLSRDRARAIRTLRRLGYVLARIG